MDLAWVVPARPIPSPGWSKLGSRITAIHVKDIAPAGQMLDEDGWADVGTGTLDWKRLIADATAKTKAATSSWSTTSRATQIRFARARSNPSRSGPESRVEGRKWQRPTASASWVPAIFRRPICGSLRCSRASRCEALPTSSAAPPRSGSEEFSVAAMTPEELLPRLRDRRDREPHDPGSPTTRCRWTRSGRRQARLSGEAVRADAQGRQGAEEGGGLARRLRVGSRPTPSSAARTSRCATSSTPASSARSRTARRM